MHPVGKVRLSTPVAGPDRPRRLRPAVSASRISAVGPVRVPLPSSAGRVAAAGPAASLRARMFGAGWPLQWLLLGFPLWWVLGLSTFIFPILALPMAVHLKRLRRCRPLRLPPAFTLWALYLAWQIISLAAFRLSPPGTYAGGASTRLIGIALNLIEMAGITITLLYVVNLPVALVSQLRLSRWLSGFFLTVAAGGVLGIVASHLSFPSALELVLPHRVRSNSYVQSLVHPATSQLQSVLGAVQGRPSAPFGFTNTWGNTISLLLVFFIASWIVLGSLRRRLIGLALVAISVVPIIFSLNRGLWIGLAVTALWVTLRHIHAGRVRSGLLMLSGMVAVIAVIALSPLGSIIQTRLENGVSDSIRLFVAGYSIEAAHDSPLIGYGSNRHIYGSVSSIAVGETSNCDKCGGVPTGSTGELWSIMFDNGLVGVALHYSFFLAQLWYFRRRTAALDEASLAVIALVFVYMLFYGAIPVAPTITMIAVGMLARTEPASAVASPRLVSRG